MCVLQCIMGVGVVIDLRPGAGNMKPCGRRRRWYCGDVCVYREEVFFGVLMSLNRETLTVCEALKKIHLYNFKLDKHH